MVQYREDCRQLDSDPRLASSSGAKEQQEAMQVGGCGVAGCSLGGSDRDDGDLLSKEAQCRKVPGHRHARLLAPLLHASRPCCARRCCRRRRGPSASPSPRWAPRSRQMWSR